MGLQVTLYISNGGNDIGPSDCVVETSFVEDADALSAAVCAARKHGEVEWIHLNAPGEKPVDIYALVDDDEPVSEWRWSPELAQEIIDTYEAAHGM